MTAARAVVLKELPFTSPSTAEVMRGCRLRAGLGQAQALRSVRIGNPKAWLGIAYHNVMAHVPEMCARASTRGIGDEIDGRWEAIVNRLEKDASSHPLNRRFGPAVSWPGYFVMRETARYKASELAAHIHAGRGAGHNVREHEFTTSGGRLRGTPDLVTEDEILDYKTGRIYEDAGDSDLPLLKEAYVRQLRIYGFLVHEETGRWRRRGVVIPAIGPREEVNLIPEECAAQAREALTLLDTYNSEVGVSTDAADLAAASEENCRWCAFKLVCPAFWRDAVPSWTGSLDGEAAAGAFIGRPQPTHGGAALSVTMQVDAGTLAPGSITIGPLSAAAHSDLAGGHDGERIRVVGLRRRESGAIVPTSRTVSLIEEHVPKVVTQAPARPST